MNGREWDAVLNYIKTSGLSVEDVLKALQAYQRKQAQDLKKQLPLPFTKVRQLR
jgi:ornithine cyclodeaminase/alanine dehydrogenase-like protein (mu-crystallin family)